MPNLREIKREGKKVHMWLKCPKCGNGKWQFRYNGKRYVKEDGVTAEFNCQVCNSRKGAVGRRSKMKDGYIRLVLSEDDPYYPMSNSGTIPEHRYILAKHLGRLLTKGEHTHHINGVKDDNRVENLELWYNGHPIGQRLQDLFISLVNSMSEKEFRDLVNLTKYSKTLCETNVQIEDSSKFTDDLN